MVEERVSMLAASEGGGSRLFRLFRLFRLLSLVPPDGANQVGGRLQAR